MGHNLFDKLIEKLPLQVGHSRPGAILAGLVLSKLCQDEPLGIVILSDLR